jgi:hypothetical protein
MLLSISIVKKKIDMIDSNIQINGAEALEAVLVKGLGRPEYEYIMDQVWKKDVSTDENF